jgi:hypothetical protein
MPLNPVLFRRLDARFGVAGIANEGAEGSDAVVHRPGGGQQLQLSAWGESYKLRCPFCRDGKPRLYVNWRYGQPDPRSGGRYPIDYLCTCFHERCLPGNRNNRRRFAEEILSFENRNARGRSSYPATRRGRRQTAMLTAPAPGELIPLTELPVTHRAVEYLHGRGFGLGTAHRWGLSYCVAAEPHYRPAQGRIICPIDFGGQRVGWQARHIGTPPEGTPRYFSAPGMAKSQILYNYDSVIDQPYTVVVEGITDVWRLGDATVAAVAMFGHDLLPPQQDLLVRYSQGYQPVFLLLDATEPVRTRRYTDELRRRGVPTIPVQLPGDLDPADCRRDDLLHLLHQHALEAGV